MNEFDFPTGNGAPEAHPKRQLLKRLVSRNAPEYAIAPQSEGFHSPAEEGRFIRSRGEIITAVIQELMADGGRFMIKKNGIWIERVDFTSDSKKVRDLIQERLNRRIRSWKGNLPPLPPQPVQDTNEDPPGGDENDNNEVSRIPVAADHPNPVLAPAPDEDPPMDDDDVMTEAERSVSSSKFASVLQSVDMSSQDTLNDIRHVEHDQGSSSHRGPIQPTRDGSEMDQVLRSELQSVEDSTTLITGGSEQDSEVGNQNASIGTFPITVDLLRDGGLEANDKRSRSGNTIQSTEPRTNKVRFDYSFDSPGGVVEREQTFVAHDPLALDSSSVGISELEIAVKHGDVQSTGTGGLGNGVGDLSAKTMLSALTNMSLNVNDTKRLLDDLTDRTINEDRQLMGVVNLAVRAVSAVMENHAKDTTVLMKAFSFAMQLYGNHDSIKVSHDFVEQIIRVLQSSSASNIDLLPHGWWLLRVLAVCDGDIKVVIAKQGGIKMILKSMHRILMNGDLQRQGLQLLGVMALNNPVNKRAIADANGIGVILQSMRQHPQHGEVQARGCYALGQLAFQDIKNQCAVVNANGIDAILQSMRQHPQNGEVQARGCYALGQLAFQTTEYKCAVTDGNDIRVILEAIMRLHKQHGEVQARRCKALGQSAFRNTENQRAIAEANGIGMILKAMRQHEQHEEVQLWGCYALGKLTFNHPKNQRAAVRGGGIGVVLQAIQLHEQNEELRDCGCHTLAILAWNNEASWHVISESRGVLQQAMLKFQETDFLQEYRGMVLRWMQQSEQLVLRKIS